MSHSLQPAEAAGEWAVLFDLDGVLIDSGPYHFAAWRWLAAANGREFPRALFDETFGQPNAAVLPRLFAGSTLSAADSATLGERKETKFRELAAASLDWMPGARELVGSLAADAACRLGLFTSTPYANLQFIDRALGLSPLIRTMVHGGEVTRGKPAPDGYALLAARLGVPPDRCVVVEDAPAGVAAGLAAGMRVAAVATSHPQTALRSATIIVDRTADLNRSILRAMIRNGGLADP